MGCKELKNANENFRSLVLTKFTQSSTVSLPLQAAPLAHGSVLEGEIKSIAARQGIEGHRAVVRKFSELLLARGASACTGRLRDQSVC